MLVSLAFAGKDCPFVSEFDSVSSGMTWVSLDGERRRVVGRAAWSRFARELRDCDMDNAAFALERWRSQRRTTNITGVFGLVSWPVWIATPFTAMSAGKWRVELEGELYAWDGIDGERRPATPVEAVERASEAVTDVVD
jgi:hypothetical protein